MKLSIDPGNPATICIWREGKVVDFVRVSATSFATREERIVNFQKRLDHRVREIEARFSDDPITHVAIELMGDSGPTFKKKGLVSLGISTGQVIGYFQGRGIEIIDLVHTGKDCKFNASVVCKRLGVNTKDKNGKEDSHKSDSVLIGYLAAYDKITR